MLAPNVAVVGPAVLCASAGALLLPVHERAALACLWLSYFGVWTALAIKLVLHVDRIRPSRVIAGLLRGRFAEAGILLAALLAATGVSLMFATDPETFAAEASPYLVTAAAATLFGVLYFETVRTHLVSDLEAAWNDSSED
jgi:hypothetical protein